MQPLLAGWGSQLQQGYTQSKWVPVPQTRAAEEAALLALLLLVLPNPVLFISDLFSSTELYSNELHGDFSSFELRGPVWGRGCPLLLSFSKQDWDRDGCCRIWSPGPGLYWLRS